MIINILDIVKICGVEYGIFRKKKEYGNNLGRVNWLAIFKEYLGRFKLKLFSMAFEGKYWEKVRVNY